MNAAQSVFITGAATGIGMAIARKLDRLGWTVFAGVNRTAWPLRALRIDPSQ